MLKQVSVMLLLMAAGVGAVRGARGAAGMMDMAEFRKADEEGRLAQVLAAMEGRDMALGNISYKAEEQLETVTLPKGDREAGRKRVVEFRRRGEVMRMEVEEFIKPGEIRWRKTYRRESAMQVSLDTTGMPQAIISNAIAVFDEFETWRYHELLGVRVRGDGFRGSIAEWIRDAVVRGDEVKVTAAGPESPVILVTVTGRYGFRVYWMDTSRGCMISKVQRGREEPSSRVTDEFEVKKAQEISGVWVPMLAVYSTRLMYPGEPRFQETTYEVKTFVVGKMTEEDLKVPFLAGTDVTDEMLGVHYLTEADGSARLLTFSDRVRGIMWKAPFFNHVAKVDEQTVRLYTAVPQSGELLDENTKVVGYVLIGILGGVALFINWKRKKEA